VGSQGKRGGSWPRVSMYGKEGTKKWGGKTTMGEKSNGKENQEGGICWQNFSCPGKHLVNIWEQKPVEGGSPGSRVRKHMRGQESKGPNSGGKPKKTKKKTLKGEVANRMGNKVHFKTEGKILWLRKGTEHKCFV